jgi:hypothetical protein
MSKSCGKYMSTLETGILGISQTNLFLPSLDKSIIVPKPLHAGSFTLDKKSRNSKRSASIDLSNGSNGINGLSESKKRVVLNDSYYNGDFEREVCDEIQNILQSQTEMMLPEQDLFQFDVLGSLPQQVDYLEIFNEDSDISGYSITPPSRAGNPLVANSAFSEDKFENEGTELGIFSISPPSRSLSHPLWETTN